MGSQPKRGVLLIRKRGEVMSEEKRTDLAEMAEILSELSKEDLMLLKGGAMILRAKQSMDVKNQPG